MPGTPYKTEQDNIVLPHFLNHRTIAAKESAFSVTNRMTALAIFLQLAIPILNKM